ncbi:transglycosylase SLT domain-containing protein [Sneathiella sp. P13V-1]|uniref:lytic transglycosylase domain-containing protein n=1 Tax=Sneathiella sp. P13V-1 TaxID=2697366 RepID=UPI00187B2B0D|nr:lytic transglycosylase domain-containing protein [Sneathiella sp. P13V-1]MBE7638321.1 transglycosylase SLT domain-containing protein [Sneathiella sp. P13V-1]
MSQETRQKAKGKLLAASAVAVAVLFAGNVQASKFAIQDDDQISSGGQIVPKLRNEMREVPTPRTFKTTRDPKPVEEETVQQATSVPSPLFKPASIAKQPRAHHTGLMSDADWSIYREAFDLAGRRKWKEAIQVASKAEYRLPAKYLEWGWLRQYKGGASFEDIHTFMVDNPDWPYRSTLDRRAEEALVNPISSSRTLAFFSDRTPLTGMGMLRLGEALIEQGQKEKGKRWIKEAWIQGNFSRGTEKKILKAHKSLLTKTDHEDRLDRLLWDRDTEPAKRMLKRVGSNAEKLAVARIRLMTRSAGVDSAIKRIPQELQNDPGLLFDRIKWRRVKGHHEGAQDLLLKVSHFDLPNPEHWWREREIQARKLLRLGHISEAYRLASEHGLEAGGKFASAEWLSGWISLRFLQDSEAALKHFTRLYENVSYPISRARGAYWIGRSHDAMRDSKSAHYWYEEAAKYPSTFYGQMAQEEIHHSKLTPLPRAVSHSKKTADRLKQDERVLIVRHLAEFGEAKKALPFLLKMTEDAASPEEYVYLGNLATRIGRPDYAVRVAKRASQLGTELPEFNWPDHEFMPSNPSIEQPLILAITRQESAFAVDAVSRVGARGLMQLMPATARSVSRSLKLPYSKGRLTTDPSYNTLLGSTYLNKLIEKYNGSYVLAIASYNAGGSRTNRWIEEWGDPRQGDISMIDWIELIPFSETRNYVQRVMENLQIYRQLSKQDDIMVVQIVDDLKRGYFTE